MKSQFDLFRPYDSELQDPEDFARPPRNRRRRNVPVALGSLLRATDPEGEIVLRRIFPEGHPDPALCYYPSAGNDYRDLLYTSQPLSDSLGVHETPAVHLRTDYDNQYVKLDGVVYSDDRTTITIVARYRLELTHPVNYKVSPTFAVFTEHAHPTPVIWLMEVEVRSKTLGVFRRPVIYFMFENINFVSEILLRYAVKVSHFCKSREGCGFGGNRQSISVVYPFFRDLGVRYALVDDEVHFDERLFRRIAHHNYLSPNPRFKLQELSTIADWSGFRVKIFRVRPAVGTHRPSVEELLNMISG